MIWIRVITSVSGDPHSDFLISIFSALFYWSDSSGQLFVRGENATGQASMGGTFGPRFSDYRCSDPSCERQDDCSLCLSSVLMTVDRIASLDALRGIAALTVAVAHQLV
jgi:hypothetical protein